MKRSIISIVVVASSILVAGCGASSPSAASPAASAAAEYTTRRDGDQVAFEVATRNPQGPVVEWTGSVRGGAASGKAKRTMNGKTDLGTFQGAAR